MRLASFLSNHTRWAIGVGCAIAFSVAIIGVVLFSTRAPQDSAQQEQFVIPREQSYTGTIAALEADGFARSSIGLYIAYVLTGAGSIEPGGYNLSKDMGAFEIAQTIQRDPAMVWVTLPEGYRKEQIAARMARKLGWSEQQRERWVSTYTEKRDNYTEGVFFPDTYLIPVNEPPRDVADRLIGRFNDVFQAYQERFLDQNIRWTTGLTIASLVQRETASTADMPLIAGIIWNRLEQDMPLQIDATVQYARGKKNGEWWAPISAEAKQISSPFNTYQHTGVPPHPIANPGAPAIEAVLDPKETDCLYYLHDSSGTIHCAETYSAHKQNVQQYLQ